MTEEQFHRVCVVGLGYVGLEISVLCAQNGYRVAGFDIDVAKVERLKSGEQSGDDESEVLSSVRDGDMVTFSSNPDIVSGFDVAVIAVPTPLVDGLPDVQAIEAAAQTVGAELRPGGLVVLVSTTWPGTTESLVRPLLEAGSGLTCGVDFDLGYSSERIDPGNSDHPLGSVPRVVAGATPKSAARVQAFFDTIVDETVLGAGLAEAEFSKLLENTYRSVNIAMINEMATFAHSMGIDIWEAIRLAETKPFGFAAFKPGPGVGGHCVPVDPMFLSWKIEQETGSASRFVELAQEINSDMPRYIADRLQTTMNLEEQGLLDTSVLLLGYAYKPNVGDVRESPAERLGHVLLARGARVSVFDPLVAERDRSPAFSWLERGEVDPAKIDAAVLVTAHRDVGLDELAAQLSFVLDTRHVLTGQQVEYL